jgi:hypothetical protein
MDLKDILGKKNKEKDPAKKEAKVKAIGALRSLASDMVGDDVKNGMQKVTVAAKNPEDLKKGLETAEKITEEMPEMNPDMANSDESEESDMYEDTDADEAMLAACDTPEKIDEMIMKLEAKKSMMASE